MTTTTTMTPEVTSLPDLDADVGCEYQHLCTCGQHIDRCDSSAVWRVRLHGARQSADPTCSTFTLLLCDDHLMRMRTGIELILTRAAGRRCDCGKPLRHVSDVLQSVEAL